MPICFGGCPQNPVSGETVVFGVHNKVTQDAKLYQVNFVEPEKAPITSYDGSIKFTGDTEAYVVLPDRRLVVVRQLQGVLQQQAEQEFQAAIGAWKRNGNADEALSPFERSAAQAVVLAAGSDEEVGVISPY